MSHKWLYLIFVLLFVFALSFVNACGDDDDNDNSGDDDDTGDDDDDMVDDDDDTGDDDATDDDATDDDTTDDDTIDDDDDTGDDDDDPVNYALYFDNDQDYVLVPHSASLNISGSAITVEAWIMVEEFIDDWSHVITKLEPNSAGYRFRFNSGNKLQFTIMNGGQEDMCVNYIVNFPTNQWKHIAGVFDGTECRVYLDGALADSATSTTASVGTNTRNLVFGNDPGQKGFKGWLDEIRISKSVRYTDNFTPADYLTADASTVGLWHLDEGDGNAAADETTFDNEGSLNGAEWVLH